MNVTYFDGRTGLPHPATVQLRSGELLIQLQGAHAKAWSYPQTALRWPVGTTQALRTLPLPDGASLQSEDVAAWDAFAPGVGGIQERWATSKQACVAAALAMLLLVTGAVRWGLPVAAEQALAWVPSAVDATVAARLIATMEDLAWTPSTYSTARAERLWARHEQAYRRLPHPAGQWRTSVRIVASTDGADLFGLPGGEVIITDDLVRLADATLGKDADAALTGLLLRAVVHNQNRDGMRLWLRSTATGVLAAAALGDIGVVSASLASKSSAMRYSREMVMHADAGALAASGGARAGEAMARLMQALAEQKVRAPQRLAPFALSSYPLDAQRDAAWRAGSVVTQQVAP